MTTAHRHATGAATGRAAFEAPVAPAAPDLITRTDGVMGGRPVIRGTRITVTSVRGRVSGGDSIDDLVADYPGVGREAFEAALAHGEPATGRAEDAVDGRRNV